MNNVIAAILGHAELAYMEVEPQSSAGAGLSEIIKGCARARELVVIMSQESLLG